MTEQSNRSSRGGVLEQTIAGVIVLIIGAVLAGVYGILSEAKVSLWVYIAAIVAATIFATLIYPPWRTAVWGNIRKWRPLTTVGTLERARDRGRADAESDRQTYKPSVRAQWVVVTVKDEQHTWRLVNAAEGSTARDVSLHVDNRLITIGSAVDWRMIDGRGSAEFAGAISEHGRRFGVEFEIAWTNEHGERLTASYSHPSSPY